MPHSFPDFVLFLPTVFSFTNPSSSHTPAFFIPKPLFLLLFGRHAEDGTLGARKQDTTFFLFPYQSNCTPRNPFFGHHSKLVQISDHLSSPKPEIETCIFVSFSDFRRCAITTIKYRILKKELAASCHSQDFFLPTPSCTLLSFFLFLFF